MVGREKKLVTLVSNPAAGRAALFERQLPAIQAWLSDHGYAVRLLATRPDPPSVPGLTPELLSQSASVLACGGDGTVHAVVQALAGSAVPLGVVPVGTANALARSLRLPAEPLAAVRTLVTGSRPTRIALGQLTTGTGSSRYFLTMAGCGPDGALVASLPDGLKSRLGRSAYYAHAARLFLSRRWPAFGVCFRPTGQSAWCSTEAVSLLASRIPDLGGLFSGLTRSSSLLEPSLRIQLLRAPAHLALPAWMTLTRFGVRHRFLQTFFVDEVVCTPLRSDVGECIHAQADAELIGPLPITLRLVPDALTLLIPRSKP